LGTNLVGYGLAGLARRFLVYPSYCVWPASLVTIALNAAFHTEENVPVEGPFRKIFAASRLKFFLLAFGAMFLYFWFPNYIFTALSMFSWMTWIAPNNVNLAAVAGFSNGLGLNPWPTWDWNTLLFDNTDPLMVPFFATFNKFIGMFCSMFVILGLWYTNAYYTGYLPINSNHVYDNTGNLYNVSRAIDERGIFDAEKYGAYSPAYLAAGNLTVRRISRRTSAGLNSDKRAGVHLLLCNLPGHPRVRHSLPPLRDLDGFREPVQQLPPGQGCRGDPISGRPQPTHGQVPRR